MIHELSTLSDEVMQELLFVDLLGQLVERSGLDKIQGNPSSPYFLEGHQAPVRHLAKVLRLLELKHTIRLHPKSDDELQACLQKLYQQAALIAARKLGQVTDAVYQAAEKLHNQKEDLIPLAIAFGKVYYSSLVDG